MTIERIKIEAGSLNFSAPSFRMWASHYYKCFKDFQSPGGGWSPVPYALLCRAIELELKSRHLEKIGLSRVKDFLHDLLQLYDDLPASQHVLNREERKLLQKASELYKEKAFDYVQVMDAATAYKRFPDLTRLDAVTKKLLQR
jgi:hypothetical protein